MQNSTPATAVEVKISQKDFWQSYVPHTGEQAALKLRMLAKFYDPTEYEYIDIQQPVQDLN
jgi:hypothetical protein